MPATRPTPEADAKDPGAGTLPSGRAYGDDGSSRGTLALIIAVAFAFAAVWAYIFLSQKPPVAEGAITSLVAVPIHTELRQGGTAEQGHGGGIEATDQLFVLLEANVKDTAKIPLYPFEQTGTLTLPTGEQQRIRALSPTDMARAFQAYPKLAAARSALSGSASAPALPRETTLKPGAAASGLVLFVFPITAEDWDARRSFDMEISFRGQRDLALAEPAPKV